MSEINPAGVKWDDVMPVPIRGDDVSWDQETATDGTSFLGGVVQGFRDPLDASAQLAEWLARKGGFDTDEINRLAGMPSSTEAMMNARQNIQSLFGAPPSQAGRLVGNVLGVAPLGAFAGPGPASMLARVGQAAAMGAGYGALQPVDVPPDSDQFATEKAKQMATSAAGGVASVPLSSAISRIVKPQPGMDVQALLEENVRVTPGQRIGGMARRAEEAMKSTPMLGDSIMSAERRAVEDLNTAAINRALAPIGKALPKDAKFGNRAIEKAEELLGDAYDDLLPKLRVLRDGRFDSELLNLQAAAQNLHPDRVAQFGNIIKNDVLRRFSPGGGMTGETMKEAEAKLGHEIRRYIGSPDGDQRAMGEALQEAQAILRRLVERNNPKFQGELKAINEGWANFVRVRNAAARVGSKEGVFSPAALKGAVRAEDKSRAKGSFAKGTALMQDLADAGVEVLGPKVPDSGTPFRIWMSSGIPGALMAGTLGIPALAYTRPGVATLTGLMTPKRPQFAGLVADQIRALGPVAGAAAGPSLMQMLGDAQ